MKTNKEISVGDLIKTLRFCGGNGCNGCIFEKRKFEYNTICSDYIKLLAADTIEACIETNNNIMDDNKRLTEELEKYKPKPHWIMSMSIDGRGHVTCSECKKIFDDNLHFVLNSNFCPNCGVKMNNDQED